MWAPTRVVIVALVMATLAGCDQVMEPRAEGSCILSLQADGLLYGVTDRLDGAGAFTPGAYFTTMTRKRDCQDQVVANEDGTLPAPGPFQDGDSNFLEPGTRLYEFPGYSPSERLVADDGDGWYLLRAVDPVDGLIENGVQVRLFLDEARVTPPASLTARLQYNVTGVDRRTVTSGSACPAVMGVYRGDTRVPFPSADEVCAAVVTNWVLTPADSLVREWTLEIGPDAVPLEPGTYRVAADLNTHDAVLEVTFEVR